MSKHPHLTWFSLYWLFWLIAFLVPELYWVYTNPSNTLSDEVWSLESANLAHPFMFGSWTLAHWAIAMSVWLLFGWLSVHFPFGLFR